MACMVRGGEDMACMVIGGRRTWPGKRGEEDMAW